MMMRCGIALGSNMGERLEALREARRAVLALEGVAGPVVSSGVYETEPVDCAPGTASFYNAVMEVGCFLHPMVLLDRLQEIEQEMGRPSKRPRNSPRPIDLDILYVGNLVLHNEEIIIPHPRLAQRRFVLVPLCDVAPDLVLPGRDAPVRRLLEMVEDPTIVGKVCAEW